jgi:hypothetical protein
MLFMGLMDNQKKGGSLTKKGRRYHERTQSSRPANGEDITQELFANNQTSDRPRIVQAGMIDANITYELGRGKVAGAEKEHFTIRITSHRRDTNMEAVLMSGVFLTRHDAQSYINHLKSKNGPQLGA